MTVLDRGTQTPPDTLVFVPDDGRRVHIPAARLMAPVAHAWRSGAGPRKASWILVPCLVALRSEFNTLSPNRDKGSDGSIGDSAHSASTSDHNPDETGATPYEDSDNINEVHAIDVDQSGPWPSGKSMTQSVEIIRLRHQRGEDDRLQNIIWRGRIASRSWGWTWKTYSGKNPHDQHAHFSARYTTAQEYDTAPWGLLTEEDDVTPADIEAVAGKVVEKLRVEGYWPDGRDAELDDAVKSAGQRALNTYNKTLALESEVATLKADVAAIKAAVVPPTTKKG